MDGIEAQSAKIKQILWMTAAEFIIYTTVRLVSSPLSRTIPLVSLSFSKKITHLDIPLGEEFRAFP